MDDFRQNIARAIWNIRRDDEDRCDMELEDIGPAHSVWNEADAALAVLRAQEPIGYQPLFDALVESVEMTGPKPVAASFELSVSRFEKAVGGKVYLAPVPPAEPVVPDVDYLVDQLAEHARHDTERGEIVFDKWTLRAAVEAVIAAAPKGGE